MKKDDIYTSSLYSDIYGDNCFEEYTIFTWFMDSKRIALDYELYWISRLYFTIVYHNLIKYSFDLYNITCDI